MPAEPEHAHEWQAVTGYMGTGRLCIGCGVTHPMDSVQGDAKLLQNSEPTDPHTSHTNRSQANQGENQ